MEGERWLMMGSAERLVVVVIHLSEGDITARDSRHEDGAAMVEPKPPCHLPDVLDIAAHDVSIIAR